MCVYVYPYIHIFVCIYILVYSHTRRSCLHTHKQDSYPQTLTHKFFLSLTVYRHLQSILEMFSQ